MAYKTIIQSPVQSYEVVFGKRNTEYTLYITGKTILSDIRGDASKILTTYNKFLTRIGEKEKYNDMVTHFETLDSKKFGAAKVYKENE